MGVQVSFDFLHIVNLTFMTPAEVALRRVTYEEMLEDWFSLNDEPAAPGQKQTDIKMPFLTSVGVKKEIK